MRRRTAFFFRIDPTHIFGSGYPHPGSSLRIVTLAEMATRDSALLAKRQAAMKTPAGASVHAALQTIMTRRDGGQSTVELRDKRLKHIPWSGRVNAYWAYSLFSLQGRPVPLVPLAIYAVYSVLVVCIAVLVLEPNGQLSWFKNLKPEMKDVSSILGLAVFLILTFRNNSAYQRWYEGAQQFHNLCNAVNNAGRMVATVTPPKEAVDLLWYLVAALFSAKQQLRHPFSEQDYSILRTVLPQAHWADLEPRSDKLRWAMFRYGAIASTIDLPGKTAGKACEEVMKSTDPILNSFTQCTRILMTPMPFAYIAHLRSFLMLWLLILPWIFLGSYGWYSIIFCIAVGYGVMGIEEAAVEVEQPFGTDGNDVPLDDVAEPVFKALFEFLWCVDLISLIVALS